MQQFPADQTLAVIGGGRMGGALVRGWIEAGVVDAGRIAVAEPSESAREALNALGVAVHATHGDWLRQATMVIFAIKPQVMPDLVPAMAGHVDTAACVSIAAGVSLSQLRTWVPNARWIRAMPNQPVTVGLGATGLCADQGVSDQDRTIADLLFGAVGTAVWLGDESLMHAVTGLSGSGPAFVALVAEALEDGGVRAGLPRDLARALALQTLEGTARQITAESLTPTDLKNAVTSPGGTTIAGVQALENLGLRAAVLAAVEAAVTRSRELGDTT